MVDEIVNESHDSAEKSARVATVRRSNFISAIPFELSVREDAIRKSLAQENASSKSKLRKLYKLTNEIMEFSAPYTACSKGCSDCCRMNVMISQAEANYIGDSTHRKPYILTKSKIHKEDQYLGNECPFLKENACSIYEFRPYVCRKHVSFDESAYWCDPNRTLNVPMPMLQFSELQGAIEDIEKGGIFADIRDFFPK